MKKEAEVLLINPPFAEPRPYISIPTLVSYLESRGIRTAAYDLNCEFFYRFLTRERIRRGIEYVSERFLELNGRDELAFREMLEYTVCCDLLRDMEEHLGKLTLALLPFSDFQILRSLELESLLSGLTTAPYFPELLISKPQFTYASPYFEYSTADIAESTGHESFYSALLREIIAEILDEYEPRVAGISIVLTEQVVPAFLAARIIKELKPDLHVTVGGPFVSTYLKDLKNTVLFDYVDSLVFDEGELPLEQLARELAGTKPDLGRVQNLAYLKNGSLVSTPPAETLPAEASPPPDYRALPLDRYLVSERNAEMLFRLSKGCSWHRCTFCRTDIAMCREYRQAPHSFVYESLLEVIRDTGCGRFRFTSEDSDPLLLEHISKRLLEDGISIKWRCHARVDARFTRERGELYRKAGCTSLYLGVESFSDRILRMMNKGITCGLIDRVLTELGGGVPVRLYMMVGFPGETEEEALAGYGKVRSLLEQGLIGDYKYSIFEMQSGSEVGEHPERFGLSDLSRYPRSDLPSEILEFESRGMPRERALMLAAEFEKNRREWDPQLDRVCERYEETVEHVTVKGDPVEVRFNVKEILERMAHSTGLYFLPRIGEWIRYGEQHITPVRAARRASQPLSTV
ncbi:MAG: radical SAM protein [Candidatus Eremiobacteraeota bacterium]|nr:radical SAM protein [Candidatus Eremiobacteraeota bacterium]